MSGYCPQGNIECGYYSHDKDGSWCVAFHLTGNACEVCPWPSRQVRVEPPKIKDGPTVGEVVEGAKFFQRIIREAEAAGYAAAKEDAERVVENLLTRKPGSEINGTELVVAQVKHQVKAAIRSLVPHA